MNIEDKGEYELQPNDWITSDWHFGHANVIRYCNRPFASVEEMDEKLIESWNEYIQPTDRVFFLGDLAFKGKQYKSALIPKLNGRKILIKGNHDAGRTFMCEHGFEAAHLSASGRYYDGMMHKSYLMEHIPDFDHAREVDLYFCGHVHEKWAFVAPAIYNVGCDNYAFRPLTVSQVLFTAPTVQNMKNFVLPSGSLEIKFENS